MLLSDRAVVAAVLLVLALAPTASADSGRSKGKRTQGNHASERIAKLEARVARLEALLASLSLEDAGRTLRVSGVNLQIVSGAGATDGPVNGLGNLIVGYNEDEAANSCGPGGCVNRPAVRTGSHNLVVGADILGENGWSEGPERFAVLHAQIQRPLHVRATRVGKD